MKFLKAFLLLVTLMTSVITLSATPSQEESFLDDNDDSKDDNSAISWPDTDSQETMAASLRGTNLFLTQKIRGVMTCDKYPRICRAKGSPGPDCCHKKCVNVMKDGLNCGTCGKKCKYSEICCKGKCVNPMFNKKHCGGCHNKCKKGSACVYGLCSYA